MNKKQRNRRNRKLRDYYQAIDLEFLDEETKDNMFDAILMNSISSFEQTMNKECGCIPQTVKQENPMNTSTVSTNTIIDERRSLRNAVYEACVRHRDKIDEVFAINPYQAKTAKEFVDLIKEDKYDFGDDKDIADNPLYFKEHYLNPRSIIRLLPKEVDKIGHAKAREALSEANEEIKLEIDVLDPEKALEKVKAFKKRTFH